MICVLSAIYLTYFMIMTVLSVAMSVLVLRLFYRGFENPPPRWLKWLLFSVISKMIGMKIKVRECCESKPYAKIHRNSHDIGKNKVGSTVDYSNHKNNSNRERNSSTGRKCIETNADESENGYPVCQHHLAGVGDTNCEASLCGSYQCDHAEEDWKLVATVVDRFFFWFFLVCTIIPTSIILGVVRLFKPQL